MFAVSVVSSLSLSHVTRHVSALRRLQVALASVLQVSRLDLCSELQSDRGVSPVAAASPSRRCRFTGTLPNNSLSFRCCGPSSSPCVKPSSSTFRSLLVAATRSSSSGVLADLWSTYPVFCVPLSCGGRTVGTIRRDMTCEAHISAVDDGLSKCTAEVTGTAPCVVTYLHHWQNRQRGLDPTTLLLVPVRSDESGTLRSHQQTICCPQALPF